MELAFKGPWRAIEVKRGRRSVEDCCADSKTTEACYSDSASYGFASDRPAFLDASPGHEDVAVGQPPQAHLRQGQITVRLRPAKVWSPESVA